MSKDRLEYDETSIDPGGVSRERSVLETIIEWAPLADELFQKFFIDRQRSSKSPNLSDAEEPLTGTEFEYLTEEDAVLLARAQEEASGAQADMDYTIKVLRNRAQRRAEE